MGDRCVLVVMDSSWGQWIGHIGDGQEEGLMDGSYGKKVYG